MTIVVYNKGAESTPVVDPLIIHINGSDYYMGRKEVGPFLLVWPYQREEKTKVGLILNQNSLDSDPYSNRYGKVIEVGETAWSDIKFFPKPRAYVHDWIVYRRYEVQIWGHRVLLGTCPETGNPLMSDIAGDAIVVGKILGEYITHNYGPDLNPDMIDTNKHIGR